MNKIDEIIKSLDRFPSDTWGFDACVSIEDKDIIRLEEKIGFILPEDYRYFLKKYNGIAIPGWYVYGITGRKYDDIYLNYIDDHKLNKDIDLNFIAISPNGRGDDYGFMKNDDKVYFWQHDVENKEFNPDFDANNFTEWLEKIIEEAGEVFIEN